jgi:hypothetical protein
VAIITKEQLEQTRVDLAHQYNLTRVDSVRCLYCKKWGWNRGKTMNSMGESVCSERKWPDLRTASYQWCKKFECCQIK